MNRFKRTGQPLIYGHRGVRGPVPENTMAAFQRAQQEGADGIELDVRQAASGEVVVFHDEDLRRMTKGFDSRAVASLSLRALRQIDLGGGERIPTLQDVIDWIAPTDLLLNVEIKRDVPNRTALVFAVARLLRAQLKGRLIISSFDPFMLTPLALLLPRVPLAILFHAGQERHNPWRWARSGLWQAAHPEFVMATADNIASLKGRICNAWTVNDPTSARALAAAGIDGLITDQPGAIRAAVEG
jgi:glycerophosphoryl diester phosphodiesterase